MQVTTGRVGSHTQVFKYFSGKGVILVLFIKGASVQDCLACLTNSIQSDFLALNAPKSSLNFFGPGFGGPETFPECNQT
jgi:hypothetical protein